MLRLPISSLKLGLRQPAGWEELLLQETQDSGIGVLLTLLERLAEPADGAPIDWRAVPVRDLDMLLLLLRRSLLGDLILSDARCTVPGCGAAVDVSFRIGEYLGAQTPRAPVWIDAETEHGWFRLAGDNARFRLPTGGDLLSVDGDLDPAGELLRRCAQPADMPARTRRRVERAMEAVAPSLSRAMRGKCPECGAAAWVYFDVRSFVLRELRDRAAGIYQDVHLLAAHYHWSEESILGMPRTRRRYYAEMLRSPEAARA